MSVGRPHPHLDRERSAVKAKRIALGLTIEQGAKLTGGHVSRSAWHRLERYGRGSLQAWQRVATVLGVGSVEELKPTHPGGRDLQWAAPQLVLPWTTSS